MTEHDAQLSLNPAPRRRRWAPSALRPVSVRWIQVQAAMKDTPQIKAILFDADGVLQRPSVWWREALMPILGAVDIAEVDPFLRDILETELAHLCAPSGFDSALMETLSRWNRSERFADTVHALNAIRPYDDVIAVVRLLRHAGMPCHIASNQQAERARHMSEGLGTKHCSSKSFIHVV